MREELRQNYNFNTLDHLQGRYNFIIIVCLVSSESSLSDIECLKQFR